MDLARHLISGVDICGAMILFVMVFVFTMLNVKLTGFLDEEK